MSVPDLHAVILAGGSGKRFWPASRARLPKQFLPIAGDRPMLAVTFERLAGLVDPERVLVVCGTAHAALAREALPELPRANLLVEPEGRNTAACVAWAALELQRRAGDAVQVVLPADHVIDPPQAFRASLRAAAQVAREEDVLVTLGIRPTHAATGYGYIETGAALASRDGQPVLSVERFVEKPDRARAQAFCDSGRFFWNGGIFVWRTSSILSALEAHLPDVLRRMRAASSPAALAALYPDLPALSIDVAVLEKAAAQRKVRMLPIDYRWSDVGSWPALADVLPADEAGNRAAGGAQLVAHEATDCIVWGEPGTLTALVGVRDLIVVRAGDATLVCPRDRAEDVRRIVAQLERDQPSFT